VASELENEVFPARNAVEWEAALAETRDWIPDFPLML